MEWTHPWVGEHAGAPGSVGHDGELRAMEGEAPFPNGIEVPEWSF